MGDKIGSTCSQKEKLHHTG